MKHVKDFEDYLQQGIAKKQFPDIARAKALVEESAEAYDILNAYIKNTKISDKNANHIIKKAYDIIMELIRAEMLSGGFSSSGQGAHEAEVAYLRKIGFDENEIEFADKVRYFRNGILYYGKKMNQEYAEKVITFLQKVREKLNAETRSSPRNKQQT